MTIITKTKLERLEFELAEAKEWASHYEKQKTEAKFFSIWDQADRSFNRWNNEVSSFEKAIIKEFLLLK